MHYNGGLCTAVAGLCPTAAGLLVSDLHRAVPYSGGASDLHRAVPYSGGASDLHRGAVPYRGGEGS